MAPDTIAVQPYPRKSQQETKQTDPVDSHLHSRQYRQLPDLETMGSRLATATISLSTRHKLNRMEKNAWENKLISFVLPSMKIHMFSE